MALSNVQELFTSWKILSLAIFVVVAAYSKLKNKARAPLPPGPPGLPIIGNILQLADRPWLKFEEWKKQYGPIVYVNIAGQDAVVLGNIKVAADLLDRRASIYSDRARNIVANETLTGGMMLGFSQHNDVWKRQRRSAHEALNTKVSRKYHRFQEIESVILVESVLKTPHDWDNHLRRAATSLSMSIFYGWPPLMDPNDPVILRINRVADRCAVAATPGTFLVDTRYFSWFKYLPRWMCTWRRTAEAWFAKDSILFQGLFDDVRRRLEVGDEKLAPSVSSHLLQDPERSLSDREAAWLAGTLYMAGSETTSSQMAWFMLAIVLHPEAQRRGQEELDRVVGRDRLPTLQDQDNLPYINALVKETLRWRTAVPLGVPHRLCQDDVYEGYFLPKNTTCIVNVWHTNRDPDIYGPDAEDFKPERHLDENGSLKSSIADTKDESHVSYGFGRRICVGRHVSNNSMFIEIAALLWAFDIAPSKDKDGIAILPDSMDSVDEGLVIRPKPFNCVISPRSDDVYSTIVHTKESYEIRSSASYRTESVLAS